MTAFVTRAFFYVNMYDDTCKHCKHAHKLCNFHEPENIQAEIQALHESIVQCVI
jgi:hypothetical protein